MPRLLIVSFYVPPDNSPNSIRTTRMVEYLSKTGWDICVIGTRTQSGRHDVDLMKRWPSNVKVEYINFYHPYFFLINFIAKLSNSRNIVLQNSNKEGINKTHQNISLITNIKRLLHKPIKYLVFKYYYPDIFSPWIKPAIHRIVSLHRTEPFGAILTTGGPWSSLFVGYYVNLKTNLPWIIDYRDPWTITYSVAELMRSSKSKKKDLEWQKRFLQQCSLACVISKELKDAYVKRYNDLITDNNIRVLPIGYDDVTSVIYENKVCPQKKFIIKYVGSMHMMIILPFLQALSSWLNRWTERRAIVRLVFVGEVEEKHKRQIIEYDLNDITEFTGVVSRQHAGEETRSATILLLLGRSNNFEYCSVSKLFTYLSFGKPILSIVPVGTGSRIVLEAGQGLVLHPDNIHGIEKALNTLWDAWSKKCLHRLFPQNNKYIKQYSQSKIMQNLDEYLREVLKTNIL